MSNRVRLPEPMVRDARVIAEHSTEWMIEAACMSKEDGTSVHHLFFKDDPGDTYREARAICAVCPVREECLEWAIMTRQPGGLWGGKNERERRTFRRSRQRRALKEARTA